MSKKNAVNYSNVTSETPMTVGDYTEIVQMKFNVPNVLEGNLMDAHFLHYSPMARKVREVFLQEGFRFEILSDPAQMNYFWMGGLFTLVYMYDRQTVYYHRNSDAVEKLLQEFPHLRSSPLELVVNNMETPGNKILHESLHFINFKEFLGARLARYRADMTASELQSWILDYLAIESVVLTVEFLASIVPPSQIGTFARISSCNFVAHYPEDYETVLAFGVKKNGARMTAELMYLGYLAANLHPTAKECPPDVLEFFLDRCADAELVRRITTRTFQLNVNFRTVANPVHFLSLGFEGDYLKVLAEMDWKTVLMSPQVYRVFEFNFDLFLKETLVV